MKILSKVRNACRRRVAPVKGYVMQTATRRVLIILRNLKKKVPKMKVAGIKIWINKRTPLTRKTNLLLNR
uniref:Uncharacterized protein n=1 Tax=Arundo donax TaxID=35708 RepID=A0A0A9REJ7_ARUDO